MNVRTATLGDDSGLSICSIIKYLLNYSGAAKNPPVAPFTCHSEKPMPFDLVLRGGRVVDPSQKLDAVTDVAFSGGKVAMVGNALKVDPGTDVRDVSGYIVTPGLIDLHTHVYWGGTSIGIDAEEFCRTSGVTTAIDTGSAGPGNFAGFRKHVIEPSQIRILAYLHVSYAVFCVKKNRTGERGCKELLLIRH